MSYVIGMDIGTSGLKAIVVDQQGQVLESYHVPYQTEHPQTGYSEMNPDIWVDATLESLKSVFQKYQASDIEGISFSGQMHGLVVVDEAGQSIRPAILWNDTRTAQEVENIKNDIGIDTLLRYTQNTVLEGFTLPKLMWLKNHEPDNFAKIHQFMLPKDYVAFKLTGNIRTEPSDAAGTCMFDIRTAQWATGLLDKLDIDASICPKVIASHDENGGLTSAIQAQLNINVEIPVFQGGADNACGALGSGITDETKQLVSIGTSGVALSIENSHDYENDGTMHYFNHCVPNQKYVMGVTLSAGYSLEWFKSTVQPETNFESFLQDIGQSSIGANGLMYTPYLLGERTPYNDAFVRGSFIGLDANTTLLDMKRAVLEGITYSINDSVQLMKQNDITFKEIVSIGGGAKNKDWLQMQADIFNVPISTRTEEQGPAYGAAMLAAMGSGWFTSFDEMNDAWIHYNAKRLPIAEHTEHYQQLFKIYQAIYSATQSITKDLTQFK